MLIRKTQSAVFNIFFPKLCVRCGAYGAWVCGPCAQKLTAFSCPFSAKNTASILPHALYSYDDMAVRTIVHAMKYEGVKELASFMAREMSRSWNANVPLSSLPSDKVVFAPIPLHSKKLRERGWNQAELIARELGSLLRVPVQTDALVRVKNTLSQSSLSRAERLANMRGAFVDRSNSALKDKIVVLVDDVMTTGATLEQAVVALKLCGAVEIRSLVFARGTKLS